MKTTIKTRIGELDYEVGFPTEETVHKLYDEIDFQRATQAYMWAFPLASSASIRCGLFNDLGLSTYDIVLYENYLDTKSIWFTGNNTTIYGAALFDMAADGPVVVELPAAPSAGMLNDFWFRTSGKGQRYIQSFKDSEGNWLDGSKQYRLHVPANVPAQQFRSVTVYDNLTRSMTMNRANRAAVTSYDDLQYNQDVSVDLYFRPEAPEGPENNWVDTSASQGWFVWFRFYGPTEGFFDLSWQLPDFEPVR